MLRTLKFFLVIIVLYALVVAAAYWDVRPLDLPGYYAVIVPYFSIYWFHHYGVPGLLEHGGYCGWGLCSPTTFGWIFLAAFWLGVMWLVAWIAARLTARRRQPKREA